MIKASQIFNLGLYTVFTVVSDIYLLLYYTFLYIPNFIITVGQWIDIDKTTPWISLQLTRFFQRKFACGSVKKRACAITQHCCISLGCRSACLSEPSTLIPEYTQDNYDVEFQWWDQCLASSDKLFFQLPGKPPTGTMMYSSVWLTLLNFPVCIVLSLSSRKIFHAVMGSLYLTLFQLVTGSTAQGALLSVEDKEHAIISETGWQIYGVKWIVQWLLKVCTPVI